MIIWIICNHNFVVKRWFFLLRIFLLSLVVWISARATQNNKTKNSRFYDLKILGYRKLQNKDLMY